MAQCAGQVKRISLELGGNAPFIVFDDADLEEAVAGAITCKFRNSGQTCISANRMLVQERIYDEFLDAFTTAVSSPGRRGRLHTRRQRRPADRRAGVGEGRAARRRCPRRRRRAGGRRRAARRALLCAVDPHRRQRRDGDEPRGDVRPGRRHRPVRDRGRSGADRERHALRALGLLLLARHRPHHPRRRGTRVRDPRRQHRAHLDGGGALRRRQGVRHRPRGLVVRDRGMGGAQILGDRRHRGSV